ncbi:MAG: glycosyltransferase family 4 protein [Cyanobacteria bacterium P01_F01_bin.150]
MKISIATGPWLPVPALQGGAIPRIWHGLAEQFAASGHEVKVLCRSYKGQKDREAIKGVEYIRWGGLPQSTHIQLDLLKDLMYAACLTPTLPEADVLIINDFWLPVFAALRKKAGKIIINSNRFPKGQYALYQKTTLFAAASSAVQQEIIKQCPALESKIRVIPNPIDTAAFRPEFKAKRESKIVLYVGRIHPEKGIHILIDAFQYLSQKSRNIKLRIIGPYRQDQGGGGVNYFKLLKSKIQKCKGIVEFIEPIFDTSILAQEYQRADIFCYPSLAEKGESFGIAPLEAMACGLVPVVSDLQCFKDFIHDGKNGHFFNHRSSQAEINLANTLYHCMNNEKLISSQRERSIRTAQAYSYESVSKLYIEEFKNLPI